MDSLLANYASSDDEEEEQQNIKISNSNLNSKPSSLLFSKLPPPKSSLENSSTSSSFSPSLFSSLPQPKSQSQTTIQTKPKKVIQFTPPINPNNFNEDDDDEEETPKPIKDSSSNTTAAKALSSVLPAPKNSLCLAPTASSRKHAFESHGSSLNQDSFQQNHESSNLDQHNTSLDAKNEEISGFERFEVSGYENYNMNNNWSNENYNADNSYNVEYGVSGSEDLNANESVGYGYGVGGYENYNTNNNWSDNHSNNWSEGNVAVQAPVVHEMDRIVGKRRKNDVPAEFVEVNQAELMKNRPREDQVKATGIAFGPAYQPVSTSKGKPSKLHKRKHQIGSLYFDMRQKETELAERRSKGFLTKAETQAKYGW